MAKFSKKQRLYLYKFCADMITTELPLYDALVKLQNEGKALLGTGFAKKVGLLTENMKAGLTGASIAVMFEGLVPQSELSVINAAEQSGSLADGFMTLVNVITYNSELKSKIISSVTFPIIMFIISLTVIAGYALKVFPAFESVVPVSKWPKVTQVLYTFGQALAAGLWMYILAWVVFAVIIIKLLLTNLCGPLRNKVVDRILPFSTYKQIAASIFLNNLALMLKNNIPLNDGLAIILLNSNKWLRSHINGMRENMAAGMSYGEALNTGLFGAETLLNISLYAGLPSFNEVLNSVSNKSRENVRSYILKLSGVLKSLSTLVLGGSVIWVFAALFSLSDTLGKMGSSGSF
ncbi:type II secretion system F family protein [Scandinavium sp. V105_16]|uniref:Type II secretion system F family protein n=1 Tax=Scandinavium lactucae TaxID=3095028 RepID=A0AAJ2VYB5_9ENTR|nr:MULTISPECIES: type II secretion system F family protein [unclassified Scandinavium]MDX6019663.1 type II secretion system F family protein [Scandinavium sp. V105_16]MDX6032678.1 type II secretion system F family protein [Scandinavium sp. V105_12]